MSLDRAAWRRRRAGRLALAHAALHDADAARALWGAWAWAGHDDALAAVRSAVLPGDPGLLAAWATAEPPAALTGPCEEAEWDLAALAGAPAPDGFDTSPEVFVGYALARLGDEVAQRERDAWRVARWPTDPADAEVAQWWRRLFAMDLSPQVTRRTVALLRPAVREAFTAVGRGLGLPHGVIEAHLTQADEALEGFGLGAHLAVAARVVETAGEPLGALASALDEAGRARVARCVASHTGWSRAWALVPGPEAERLSVAGELALALRLAETLGTQPLPATALDLPGWSVVRAHRGRMRGRLRAASRAHPDALARAVLGLPGLLGRTRAGARRWAWAWAWREARVGFAFSLDRTWGPDCVLSPEAPVLHELDEAARPRVRTLLLLVAGRGCWQELEAWLSGAPGRSLSSTFYRCLADAGTELGDPGDGRSRTYLRLRAHLSDGGVDTYVEELTDAARSVAQVPTGRGLRERVHGALAPWWHADVPLPEHHLTPFVERLAAWLRG